MNDSGTWAISVGGRPLNGAWHLVNSELGVTVYWMDKHWLPPSPIPCTEVNEEAVLLAVAGVFYYNRNLIPQEVKEMRHQLEEALHAKIREEEQVAVQAPFVDSSG